MQAWSRIWRQMTRRPARQAWGLASNGVDGALVGLSSHKSTVAQVHALEHVAHTQSHVSGESLRLSLKKTGTFSRRRLYASLQDDALLAGVLKLPAHLPRDDWPSEVQLELAQLLQLSPDQVHFDFQPEPMPDGLMLNLHWVGCDQATIRVLKDRVRSIGWLLDAVEPASHAAYRAACHLRGGLSSMLTQAPQDWQFDLTRFVQGDNDRPWGRGGPSSDPALLQAMNSPAGPRLVACGLALKAWTD
jgi:hypothetical protein